VDGAADGWVAGERYLGGGKEDAHLGGVGGVIGRLDEDRLAEIELPRDGLHLRGGQPVRILNDGQRIAGKWC
jgi:hypothetical protein